MIVTGLMRYHIRCVTQPPIDGQSLAGGSSTAEGAASAPPTIGRQREGATASAALSQRSMAPLYSPRTRR